MTGRHVVLSTKTHAVNIFIHSISYLRDLEKKAALEKKGHVMPYDPAPHYDMVSIKPGYNMLNDEQWDRLNKARAFKELLQTNDIFYNSQKEFSKYDAEIRDTLENNVEYKEATKARRLAEADSRAVELERLTDVQKKQIEVLSERLAKLEARENGSHSGKHSS